MSGQVEPRQGTDRKRVILVVEDHILVRTGVSEYLREAGFQVIEATDAVEAMAVFNIGTSVDFVFTDVDMPGGIDGVRFAAWVAAHHADVPVMVTSGEAAAGHRIKREVPTIPFVEKPYLFREVEARIRDILRSKDGG